jgi:tripartite-type tricarboxylate transporter receptor subunit TctC
MKLPRRHFPTSGSVVAALPVASRIARARTFPSRPITMIVPFPPGGGSDAIGRIVSERGRG